MNVEIGLPGQSRAEVGRVLNKLLADEHVLYVKTRNYHWNVVGPKFKSLHEFFEEQYDKLAETIDEIAERARALDVRAAGTMSEFKELARLDEEPETVPSAEGMLANLTRDHEAIIQQLRADIERCEDELGDVGTADFLTGLLSEHEKQAWMLRAFLKDHA